MSAFPNDARSPQEAEWRVWVVRFLLASGLLLAVASPLLFAWARFASRDGLASYVLIIPLIAVFLGWRDREDLIPA